MARLIYKTMNPKVPDADDCVVNSLCLTMGGTWLKNLQDMCKVAQSMYVMPNDIRAIKKYMELHRCFQIGFFNGTKPMTVEMFADSHPKGKYCVIVSGHMCAVIDGVVYDKIYSLRKRVQAVYQMAGK